MNQQEVLEAAANREYPLEKRWEWIETGRLLRLFPSDIRELNHGQLSLKEKFD